jgi:mono/diheme cytochrome c family protein
MKFRTSGLLATTASLFAIALSMAPSRLLADDDFAYGRRLFLDKAQCSYCHGWAGDGAGEPQSNGGAANLRNSSLDRKSLIEVISCGVPGTPMPHFDEGAYSDNRCYGMTEAELGSRTPGLPPSTTLQKREIEALADYLLAKIIRRGPVTRAECHEAFGERGRSCDEIPQ